MTLRTLKVALRRIVICVIVLNLVSCIPVRKVTEEQTAVHHASYQEEFKGEKTAAKQLENARIEVEKPEAEKAEKARIEKIEAERLERERLEAEELERERLEAERLEKARLEAERLEEAQRKEELTKIVEKVIYIEARGEPLEGKITVGATVVNRLASAEFPNDIEEVLEAYASIRNVTEEKLAKVPECRIAAERAVAGEDPLAEVLGGPTYYFYNPDYCDEYQLEVRENIKVTARIGNHVFYSEWE